MIVFTEDEDASYRGRTIKNASADVTIAFAIDFTTAGEKLTKKAVLEQGKLYIPINVDDFLDKKKIHEAVWSTRLKILELKKKEISINIAGNGIYRLKDTFMLNQKSVDYFTHYFLNGLIDTLAGYVKVGLIRSGGQSGFDEAGAKAGYLLGITTLVHAPKKWCFRDIDNVDHYNELEFKNRFIIKNE